MQVWFDMDGTIADFYGVPTWREDLDNLSTRPYETARPLCKFCTLARLINALQNKGYSVGIISWSSMDAPPTFDRAVEGAKKEWLARHLPSVKFDRETKIFSVLRELLKEQFLLFRRLSSNLKKFFKISKIKT